MRVLLVSGSLREGLTNTALLKTVGVVAPSGVTTVLYRGIATLPHFNPDDDREGQSVDRAVAELREQVAAADALLICTSEYAGALPGATKNLLEWTVGDATYHKTVAWINASGPAAPTGAADAHDSLRKVLGYVDADIAEAACARIPVTRDAVGEDGTITDPDIRARIADALRALVAHVARERPPDLKTADPVLGTDEEFFAALLARNAPALEVLLAEDFVIVEVSSGQAHPRGAFLDAVRSGAVVFEAIERWPQETLIRRYGNVAVVVGRTTMTFTGDDSTFQADSRYTHVYALDGGKWRLLSAQGTPIPEVQQSE
jgi:NAD(P)H-dependent FMN reductase/ketosteroid isomerase-like protein